MERKVTQAGVWWRTAQLGWGMEGADVKWKDAQTTGKVHPYPHLLKYNLVSKRCGSEGGVVVRQGGDSDRRVVVMVVVEGGDGGWWWWMVVVVEGDGGGGEVRSLKLTIMMMMMMRIVAVEVE